MKPGNHAQLADVFESADSAQRIRAVSPASYDAAANFWAAVYGGRHLTLRQKELVLVALHASASSINEAAIVRHVGRAKSAGASDADILDVLLAIVGLGNHPLYFAVPIVLEEFKVNGRAADAEIPDMRPDIEALKNEYIRTRGFWNPQRDVLAKLMPDYFVAFSELSMAPARHGSLSPKERELIYIAIDCSITHTHEPGLRLHVRNGIKHGLTRDEVMETLQICALMAMETYILGAQAVVQELAEGPRGERSD